MSGIGHQFLIQILTLFDLSNPNLTQSKFLITPDKTLYLHLRIPNHKDGRVWVVALTF